MANAAVCQVGTFAVAREVNMAESARKRRMEREAFARDGRLEDLWEDEGGEDSMVSVRERSGMRVYR